MCSRSGIYRGARGVIAEAPLFAIEPPALEKGQYSYATVLARVDACVAGLRAEDREAFLQCHGYHRPDEPADGRHLYIFRSNAYTMPDGRWGMFLKMARLNHSCQPNVANDWTWRDGGGEGRKAAWALRDIDEGEEGAGHVRAPAAEHGTEAGPAGAVRLPLRVRGSAGGRKTRIEAGWALC